MKDKKIKIPKSLKCLKSLPFILKKPKKVKSSIFHYKRDIEEVLKLNVLSQNSDESEDVHEISSKNFNSIETTHPKNENIIASAKSLSPNKSISTNFSFSSKKNNINPLKDEYLQNLSKFAFSVRTLQTHFPDNPEIKNMDIFAESHNPARDEHIKLEDYIKKQIEKYANEENELKNKKSEYEKNILSIDNDIFDKELNIEVFSDLDRNFNIFYIKKALAEKYKDVIGLNSKELQLKIDGYINKLKDSTGRKIKDIEDEIRQKKYDKIKINEGLNLLNEKIKNVRTTKKNLIDKLYNHYLNILHEGKDTRKEGLSWVIREIFSLNKKVLLSYMPEFLDTLCIQYLFEMTHINIKILDIEQKIKTTKNDFIKNGIIEFKRNNIFAKQCIENHQNDLANDFLKQIQKTFCYSNKISNKSTGNLNSSKDINEKKNIANVGVVGAGGGICNLIIDKKNINIDLPFINGDPNNVCRNVKDEEYTKKMIKEEILKDKIPEILKVTEFGKLIKNTGYYLRQEEVKKVENYFKYCKELNFLRKEKEKMKLNEMNRIFKEFQKNNYEQKFNVDKTTVICALIGEDNINAELLRQDKREKKYIEEICKGQLHKKILSYGNSPSNKSWNNIGFFKNNYYIIKTSPKNESKKE